MSNIVQALKLISERSGDLIALLEDMPEVLHDAGEGMERAGVWAKQVGRGLSPQGQAGSNPLTLSGTLDQLASTTKRIKLADRRTRTFSRKSCFSRARATSLRSLSF